MKKTFTRLLTLVMVSLMIVASFAYAAAKVPNSTSDYYVNDFAKVFSDEDKAKMLEVSKHMNEEYNINFVISTIESLEDMDIAQYAELMYEKYFKAEEIGAVILFVKEDCNVFIKLSNEIAEITNAEEVEKLITEYAVPAFENKDYSSGVYNLQMELINYIMSDSYRVLIQKNIVSNTTEQIEVETKAKVEDKITVDSNLENNFNITSDVGNIFTNRYVLMIFGVLIVLLLLRCLIWYHAIREGRSHVK